MIENIEMQYLDRKHRGIIMANTISVNDLKFD